MQTQILNNSEYHYYCSDTMPAAHPKKPDLALQKANDVSVTLQQVGTHVSPDGLKNYFMKAKKHFLIVDAVVGRLMRAEALPQGANPEQIHSQLIEAVNNLSAAEKNNPAKVFEVISRQFNNPHLTEHFLKPMEGFFAMHSRLKGADVPFLSEVAQRKERMHPEEAAIFSDCVVGFLSSGGMQFQQHPREIHNAIAGRFTHRFEPISKTRMGVMRQRMFAQARGLGRAAKQRALNMATRAATAMRRER